MRPTCVGTRPVGRAIVMIVLFAFIAGMTTAHAISFFRGQRPLASMADAAIDLTLAAIFIVNAVIWGRRISENHFVRPENPQ